VRVLDIGSGSGLLGIMAARAGADKVICCERETTLAGVAGLIVDNSGVADKVTVFNESSMDITAADMGEWSRGAEARELAAGRRNESARWIRPHLIGIPIRVALIS
jgi:16S rRNA G966 N2-methylase RsmD